MSSITKARRVVLLDQIRGLSILLMVLYHGAYDLVVLFGINISFFYSPVLMWAEVFFASLFILISGIVSVYSHSNIKRGILCFLIACLMTIVTYLAVPEALILWGVLHLLGFCMIFYGLFGKLLSKMPCFILGILCFSLFLMTFRVPYEHLGVLGKEIFTLPSFLYESPYFFWLGFPTASFYSADYFSVIPWLFLFLTGTALGPWFKDNRAPQFFYQNNFDFIGQFLTWCGKHSLWIYVLHQPILYGIFTLIFMLLH